ncbi:MAG: helix-turn-helix domain-containing protein [Prevotella sp.]|nr:helix-turn-helix domain-containing protein [Prevotella sp.]
MKQKYLVIVLLGLIVASGATSFQSYRATERVVEEDMSQALASALAVQQNDVISADTIKVFNSHLQLDELRGRAILAVNTRQKDFKCEAQCSVATILAMSDQKPAAILWLTTMAWAAFCLYRRRRLVPLLTGATLYGGLHYIESESRFIGTDGKPVKLTPMQQQLMEMFFRSSSHSLTKTEICDALWPKKPDASETLYTLIRRLKPIIEQHSNLKIESDRGRAYGLIIR